MIQPYFRQSSLPKSGNQMVASGCWRFPEETFATNWLPM